LTISDRKVVLVEDTIQMWNYLTGQYDVVGMGSTSYISTSGNESAWLNVTLGVTNYVNGGARAEKNIIQICWGI
jgi:hypothetical protein